MSRGRRVKRRKERRGKSGRRKGSRRSRRKGDEEENGEEASALWKLSGWETQSTALKGTQGLPWWRIG